MDLVGQIMAYESGELDHEQTVEFFQGLIDNGMAWTLQGHYGRTAMDFVHSGECVLPEKEEKMVCELTVVVPVGWDTNKVSKLDKQVGLKHDRHYEYAGKRDVVYYVEEAEVDKIGGILNGIKAVVAYNFNDPQPA